MCDRRKAEAECRSMMTTTVERGVLAPPPSPVRISPRTRRTVLIAALGLALAAGGGWYGYDWWTAGRFFETTDDAYAGGNVTAISPHVAGFIAQIAVRDNQYVRAGDVLVRLDSRDYQAA